MKPEQMYQQLKELVEKLDIKFIEQNLKKSGPRVQSGFCKVKGQRMFIMDSRLPVHDKNSVLAAFISKIPHENMYLVPAVREFIQQHTDSRPEDFSEQASDDGHDDREGTATEP